MSEEASPSITFMLQYTEANAQYVDYTNRNEAVEIESDLSLDKQSLEDLTQEQVAAIQESVPEQNLNFREYIDYMNRSYATEEQNEEWTAVFNQEVNYLQKSRVNQLKENLEAAYHNGSLLWQGVISFDNNWLAQEGLFDKLTGQVDQQAIKNAVREIMPKVIQNERLSETAFWWGNIHLNTDNIHVHIGLSEIESAREKIFYQPRGRMEYRGNFSQKTIKQIKSGIFHNLLNPEIRSLIIRKEQLLANLKADLLAEVFKDNKVAVSAEKNFLEQAYNHLPQGKQWRYASNAKDFAVSKFFINRYLDSYFANEGKESYQKFLAETREFLSSYTHVYSAGKNQATGYDIEKLLQRRELEVRERLGNKILKRFKEEIPRIASLEVKNNLNGFSKGNQGKIREQLPGATFVHIADVWEKMGYRIPEGTEPLGILKPEYNSYDKNGKGIGKPNFVTVPAYDITQVRENILNKRLNLKQLSLFSSDELKELIDAAKKKENRSEKEQQELGTFRYALKLSLLAEKQAELLIQKQLLDQVQPLESDKAFIHFKKVEINERLEHVKLQLTPNFKLGELEKNQKILFNRKFENSVQFSVKQADREHIQVPIKHLRAEIKAVSSVQDERLLSLLKGRSITRESYIEELETHISIFQLKGNIFENNIKIANNHDETLKRHLKQENAKNFYQLKQLYQRLIPEGESEVQSQIAQAVSKTMQEQRYLKQTGLQQSKGKFKASPGFMKNLTRSLVTSQRNSQKALIEKARSDERAEQEERAKNI
ncbi:TPA: hypothetical protein VJE30_001331 [Streptococcus pyogenes]|nr:hypothetical protein [Streptococcus pyogenes]